MNIINLHDKNLYYIGGVVRDEILGRESLDVDLTYVGNAIEFAKNIKGAKIVQINEPFGTVRINFDGKEIDIASTRNEKYPQKGHLPEVFDIGCSLKDDVYRRDFTINSMAKSTLTGKIVDYTGGLDDIKNKKLRVLHDKSFIDDPTRILRALKFSIRFGFELDEQTKQLQETYLKNIDYDMSYKRLQKELKETFNLNSSEAFERFIDQGIYKLISPKEFQKAEVKRLELLINKYNLKNVWIMYVGLLPDISNLPLTKIEKKIVDDFNKLKEKTYNSDFEIYKSFEGICIESIIMFVLYNEKAVIKYLEKLKDIKLSISGLDIQKLGIKPSEKYQKCFDYILQEKLKNPAMSKQDELYKVKKFFQL